MKSGIAWILALSLCANGALLAAHLLTSRAASPSGSIEMEPDDSGAGAPAARPVVPAGSEVADAASHAAGTATPAGAMPASFWTSLDLNDPAGVARRLRASGMSERDVRAIVGALVRDRFKARIEASQRGEANQPFWKASSLAAQRQRFSESYAVWREVEAMTAEVLGPEPLDPLAAQGLRQQYGPLSDEKLQALMRLERDYSDLSMQARSATWGTTMPWERDALAFIEQEKRRDIEALLSPEEREQYALHASATAHNLRHQLAGFEPTEAEFRAIFAVQEAFDRAQNLGPGAAGRIDPITGEKARAELLEQIKVALGEERFRDYERSTDGGYTSALAVVGRLNLPKENATSAYTLAQETRAGVKALNRDASLTPAERAAAMGRLLAESNARLDALLTRSGAEAFRTRSIPWRYVESELRQKEREAR